MLPSKMPIYCATTPVDLRRSFDGLAAAAREVLAKDPRSGALFLFVNKAGDRLKALWWDRTGYCLLYNQIASHYTSLRSGPRILARSPRFSHRRGAIGEPVPSAAVFGWGGLGLLV